MSRAQSSLERALSLLGPLEGRIMRAVWTGRVAEPFVVRDVRGVMPELAYTTIMTTVNRLAEKGLLRAESGKIRRAIPYVSGGDPPSFLAQASAQQAKDLVSRYGEAALAAFAAQLDGLTPEQQARLQALVEE